MMPAIKRLGFLITVYAKSLFAYKRLAACALLSGLCCLAILLGAAVVFSPSDQYQHFTDAQYCQWAFDEPIDYARVADKLARDMSGGRVSSAHVIAKARSANGPVVVYGLSGDVFNTKNAIMYGGADTVPNNIQCYIDQRFIPYEYNTSMDDLIISINGIDFNSAGKSFLLPYTFPSAVISQIGYDDKLSVSLNKNIHMRIYGESAILSENADNKYDQSAYAVYVPLEFMAEQHIHIGAMAITMNETLTESARSEFESEYSALGFKTFVHPSLSNWSRMTRDMLSDTAREMWAVEIIMFACMINQLVFWEILMRGLKPVIKRCRMIGGSNITLKSALTILLVIIALIVLCAAAPLYVFGMSRGSANISLTMPGAVSASIIWAVGLVVYCLLIVRDRNTKGL